MSNMETVRKALLNDIAKVAVSSKEHAKILVNATVRSFLFLAEHGQEGPLNELLKTVNVTDQEGIRRFAVNIVNKYASGNAKNAFFTYSKAKGFGLNRDDSLTETLKTQKKAFVTAGLSELSKIPMARMETERDTLEQAFDVKGKVQGLIKSLAKNGEKALALAINKVAGDIGMTSGDVETIAKNADPVAKGNYYRELAAREDAKLARQNIANTNEKPEAEKVSAAG